MKGNGAVMVTRIFAVELLNLEWSEVIMPAGLYERFYFQYIKKKTFF